MWNQVSSSASWNLVERVADGCSFCWRVGDVGVVGWVQESHRFSQADGISCPSNFRNGSLSWPATHDGDGHRFHNRAVWHVERRDTSSTMTCGFNQQWCDEILPFHGDSCRNDFRYCKSFLAGGFSICLISIPTRPNETIPEMGGSTAVDVEVPQWSNIDKPSARNEDPISSWVLRNAPRHAPACYKKD